MLYFRFLLRFEVGTIIGVNRKLTFLNDFNQNNLHLVLQGGDCSASTHCSISDKATEKEEVFIGTLKLNNLKVSHPYLKSMKVK
jgi:hypothetical protein